MVSARNSDSSPGNHPHDSMGKGCPVYVWGARPPEPGDFISFGSFNEQYMPEISSCFDGNFAKMAAWRESGAGFPARCFALVESPQGGGVKFGIRLPPVLSPPGGRVRRGGHACSGAHCRRLHPPRHAARPGAVSPPPGPGRRSDLPPPPATTSYTLYQKKLLRHRRHGTKNVT